VNIISLQSNEKYAMCILVKEFDQPKESARERATRKWHNNRVIHKIKTTTDHEPQMPVQQPSTMRKEIMKIFAERDNQTMRNYILSIQSRRIKLLKEKLRRLRAESDSE
jgi:hypothetical protein